MRTLFPDIYFCYRAYHLFPEVTNRTVILKDYKGLPDRAAYRRSREAIEVPATGAKAISRPASAHSTATRRALSTFFHRRGDTSDGLASSLRPGAWSAVMLGASQGPREVSVRACKAARRVVFRGQRRASPPLDDVATSPARRLHPGGREKTIICAILL